MGDLRQFTIEIRYVPLPPDELEKCRARLWALLLQGALRLARQKVSALPGQTEADPAETIQK